MTPTEFYTRFGGTCDEGREFAEKHTTLEAAWADPDPAFPPVLRVWAATREGVLTKDELAAFAKGCAERAKGYSAANWAAYVAAYVAAAAANAAYAANAAANWAARGAADAANAADAAKAAYAAAYWAADAAANWAAYADERKKQAEWLIENAKPNFEVK